MYVSNSRKLKLELGVYSVLFEPDKFLPPDLREGFKRREKDLEKPEMIWVKFEKDYVKGILRNDGECKCRIFSPNELLYVGFFTILDEIGVDTMFDRVQELLKDISTEVCIFFTRDVCVQDLLTAAVINSVF